MIRGKKQTSGFPRVNCAAPECKRGTTRIEVLEAGYVWINTGNRKASWLCPHHWRLVPQGMKRRYQAANRAWGIANRKSVGNELYAERAAFFARQAQIKWNIILATIQDEAGSIDGLPPLMHEELRKLGLV